MSQILVVNEGDLLVGLITGSLRDDGHEITHADNPIEALDITANKKELFDLILAEVLTKPFSSIELVRRLKSMGIKTPVLFMSDSRSVAAVVADSLGPSAIIERPFTAAQLRNRVRKRLTARKVGSRRFGYDTDTIDPSI